MDCRTAPTSIAVKNVNISGFQNYVPSSIKWPRYIFLSVRALGAHLKKHFAFGHPVCIVSNQTGNDWKWKKTGRDLNEGKGKTIRIQQYQVSTILERFFLNFMTTFAYWKVKLSPFDRNHWKIQHPPTYRHPTKLLSNGDWFFPCIAYSSSLGG